MLRMSVSGARNDDPRKLRELLGRAASLASDHELASVVVGLAGPEGDLLFPEVVDFFESQLRVDDSIFRMTRERTVLLLADVDRERAEEIIERLLDSYRERFTPTREPEIQLGYFEVTPQSGDLSVKQVLPSVFAATHH
jgi:hypothetical protein